MSEQSTIQYCPVPACYVPVMVSLAADAGPRDALEEAVASLVSIGRGFPHDIAQILCIATELVDSALDELFRRKILRREEEEGPYLLSEKSVAQLRPRERPGYLLWDTMADQPLFQIVLGKPHEEPYIPRELSVLDLRVARPKRFPKPHHISRVVRSLPEVPDLRLLVPLGRSYRSQDTNLIQRLRYEGHRKLLIGHAYVAVEFRPQCDPVVWRPSIVPTFKLDTSLDPEGYTGLRKRIPECTKELDRIRMELDPALLALLAAEGYPNAAALFQDAERRIQVSLVGSWGNSGWEEVQQAAIEAMRQTILSRFLRSSLQGGSHAWADVLERAMLALINKVVRDPDSFNAWERTNKQTREQAIAERSRQLGQLAEGMSREQKSNKKDLAKALLEGSLGIRLRALAALWAVDQEVARNLTPVLQERPDFFRKLDNVIEDRNRVVHPDARGTPIPRGFRAAVLDVVKAMMEAR